VRAGLDDGVQHASQSLAELRLESPRLDLHLIQEIARDSRPEGAINDVVGADTAVSRIGDVDSVDQIGILQPGGSAYGKIAGSRPSAAHDSRRRQEEIAVVSGDGDGSGEIAHLDVRADGG